MYRARLQQQLKQYSQPEEDSDCWIWQGQCSNSGHGRLKIQDENGRVKMVSAEDASYIAFIATIPDKHLVMQTCGKRLCINPDHLALKAFPTSFN